MQSDVLPTLKLFSLCVMNAINTCWYGALEKPTVYKEFLLWLQDYSGCLVLKALWGTTSDHSGQRDSWGRRGELSPNRVAHHQGKAVMCQGTQSLPLVPVSWCRRAALQVLWVACLSLSLPIPAAWCPAHLQYVQNCAF